MVSVPEWEYTYRWPQLVDNLADSVSELEARDQSLEDHLRSGYGSSSCFIDFEYTYRWGQILQQPQDVQIKLLEANMQALEQAVTDAGGCPLEFPYRWAQFLSGLARGEGWAIACAEENDRAIEARFNECSCGAFVTWLGSTYTPFSPGTFGHIPLIDVSALDLDILEFSWTGDVTMTGGTLDLVRNDGVSDFVLASFDISAASGLVSAFTVPAGGFADSIRWVQTAPMVSGLVRTFTDIQMTYEGTAEDVLEWIPVS